MPAASSADPKSPGTQGVGYNLAAIALALVLLGLALAYAIDAANRAGRTGGEAGAEGITLTRTIGGRTLQIPASWFRTPEENREGFAKEIALRLFVPLGPAGEPRAVDITLLPRSGVRTSATLLDGVYLHMFTTEQREGPAGLIGKPLRAQEGYGSETVWYDPLSAAPFVAKCSEPVGAGTGRCLRAVHLAPGIAAVFAFDADMLAQWRTFDATIDPHLTRIGARAAS